VTAFLKLIIPVLVLTILANYLRSEILPAKHPLDYQMIEIPAGSFDLKIPVLTSFSVDYITKPITFKKSYLIGKYEVSNQLWNLCYQEKGCNTAAKIQPGENLNHPVVRVNWHQAYQFTRWFSQKTGQNYRLPTEEEWSYAAHLGKSHQETLALYDYSSLGQLDQQNKITKSLGFYGTNDWQIADTNGNVWEWTLSCWFASVVSIINKIRNVRSRFTDCNSGKTS
jgi:formylglycine-generating enzyme required for sulfatase activity